MVDSPKMDMVSEAVAARKVVPIDARHSELVERVAKGTPCDGVNETRFAPLALMRATEVGAALPAVLTPSLCIVVQGRKRAFVGNQTFQYDPFNYLLVSLSLPVRSQIVDASPEQPYLCIRLDIDMREVGRLLLETKSEPRPPAPTSPPLYVARISSDLTEVLLRLLRLLDTPDDLPVLGPLAMRELWYRLLRGDMGHRLRTLTEADGPVQRIGRAIQLLQKRFKETLRIQDLAEVAHMSPSTFHARFKAVTDMSPLQFQKHLRLHEARRLMIGGEIDAAEAGHRVGYESPSQFSREYRRLFGAPPRREIASQRRGA